MKFDKMPFLTDEKQVIYEIENIMNDLEDIATDTTFILSMIESKEIPISPIDIAFLLRIQNAVTAIGTNVKNFTLLLDCKKDITFTEDWNTKEIKEIHLMDAFSLRNRNEGE